MEILIFTVFDSAAKRYLQPFFAESIEVAIRSFRQAVNEDGHQFNRFPEDYTLFHVGSFDQVEGTVGSLPAPHSLGVAITLLNRPQLLAGEE